VNPAHASLNLPFGEEYDRLNLPRQKAGLADGEPLVRVRLPYGGEGWLARRHDDVKAVLSDPRFSRAETIGEDIPRLVPDIDYDDYPNPLSMDPPDHTRLRRLGARRSLRGVSRGASRIPRRLSTTSWPR
jgi:cytochrome P450